MSNEGQHDKNLSDKFSNLTYFVEKYANFLDEVMNEFHGKDIDRYKEILIQYVQRATIHFSSLQRNIEGLGRQPKYIFSVSSLLRPLIEDVIKYAYLLRSLKFNAVTLEPYQEELKKVYNDFFHDFIKSLDNYLIMQYKHEEISEEDRRYYLDQYKVNYPEFFDNRNGPKVINSHDLSPKKIVEELKDTEDVFEKISDGYDFYFYFSIYEHFNFKTEKLIKEGNTDDKLNKIIDAIGFVINGLSICLFFITGSHETDEKHRIHQNESFP